ncbi:class I SAM-dependent methyltransferase [Blastochloris viridis]|uniref:Glycosyltransferase n=1 Tax=Blastochloris viridis TaxID=1079 RepID=A0A0H5BA22_BLAVI|nr:class I SAM-dependent methyltransferase [Blastochloris viridis]ALK10918.1 putative S-adenosylmethionine-dependent methyltransferase [Blastochloris viridis]BAR99102.1 glycosyltransferase [Blastochloris viridis]CUU43580.1 putative S-adenosylmethionine-dependent methyltransferase [Blastochloris viridis]
MSESRWQPVLQSIEAGDFAAAVAALDRTLEAAPLDSEGLMLRAVAKAAQERVADAEADLWRALAIAPAAPGPRAALGDLFVRDLTEPPAQRDFSLGSGERQTSPNLGEIREDHRSRYEFAALWLRDALAPAHRTTGIDLFCGNGYGSRILADLAGCRMVGVDGSADAVTLAETAYGGHRVVFRQAYFPFALTERALDFAVCFESIEHVEDCDGYLATVDAAVRGPILLSFPIETTLPFDINADLFRYHTRHFTISEMEEKLARICKRRIAAIRGQVVYALKNRRLNGYVPPQQMALTAVKPDSQFAVVVACRA